MDFDPPHAALEETIVVPKYIGHRFKDPAEENAIKSVERFEEPDHPNSIFFNQDHPETTDKDETTKSTTGYEIATVDFARVRIPFLIAAWILFASLAKIGSPLEE